MLDQILGTFDLVCLLDSDHRLYKPDFIQMKVDLKQFDDSHQLNETF